MKAFNMIINYWAQIAVIIGILGSTLKSFWDFRTRKREINFSRLQENKVLEIKAFYKSYHLLLLSLKKYLNQTEFGDHSKEIFSEIKVDISKNIEIFEYNCMTIKLFIDKSELDTINEISKLLSLTTIEINKWHRYNKGPNPPAGWDNLAQIREERFSKTLPALIERIEGSLRKSFSLT